MMRSGRVSLSIVFFAMTCLFLPVRTFAFWGSGDAEGKSGLNLEQGYDLNMVVTVKGKVLSVNADRGRGPVVIVMRQGTEVFHIITAPPWFWSGWGIAMKPNDEIAVRGSKAQGRDGVMYVIASRISNLTTGDSVTLRNETGRPVWKGRGGRGMQQRHDGGAGNTSGR